MHIAAERGYAEIVRLLLQHGANITAATTSSIQELNEVTPLDFARMNRCDEVIAIIEAAYRERGIAIPEIREYFSMVLCRQRRCSLTCCSCCYGP